MSFGHWPPLIPDTRPEAISVGFLRGDGNTSLMAQGYLCNIYLLDANIYLLDVKACESLTAKIHAQL